MVEEYVEGQIGGLQQFSFRSPECASHRTSQTGHNTGPLAVRKRYSVGSIVDVVVGGDFAELLRGPNMLSLSLSP